MRKLLAAFLFCVLTLPSMSQDLIVTGFEGKTTYDRYQKSQLTVFVKNAGIVAMQEDYYFVNAYLSQDQVYDYDDAYFGSSILPPEMAAGETVAVQVSRMSFATPGTYYLLLIADNDNYAVETDDTNNTLVVPDVVVGPSNVDFHISEFEVFSAIPYTPAGDVLIPSVTINTTGSEDVACRLVDRFCLSTDMVWDDSDYYLGQHFQWFDDQDNVPYYPKLGVPGNVPPGDYYVLAYVDSDENVEETDETNNIVSGGLVTIGPSDIDLEAIEISYVHYYSGLTVGYSIVNKGTTGAAGFDMALYISTDPVPGPDDILTVNHPDPTQLNYVGPGATMPGHISDYLGHLQPGAYYVILEANYGGGLPESDFSNNTTIYGPIYVEPPPVASITIETAQFKQEYSTTDLEFLLGFTFNNSGSPNYHSCTYSLDLKNSNGTSVHTTGQMIYTDFVGPVDKQWTLQLTNTLLAGDYTLEITTSNAESMTKFFTVPLKINPAAYTLSGVVQGVDGVPITAGKLFLYVKEVSGSIKFIDKKEFTTDNHFEYSLDDKEYTLYFIPDRTAFAEFVPTILGKTVILQPSSFFTMTDDQQITFEILKLEPLGIGESSIIGNVQNSGGRTSGSLSGLPVILLNSEGAPVKISYTDDGGAFEFTNLPADEYQIVFAFELDQYAMEEPLIVDVSEQNAIISVDLTDGKITASTRYETILSTEGGATTTGIYPIPVSMFANVDLSGRIEEAHLTTPSGMEVNIRFASEKILDCRHLSPGVYVLHARTTHGTHVLKLIKK